MSRYLVYMTLGEEKCWTHFCEAGDPLGAIEHYFRGMTTKKLPQDPAPQP